MSLRTPLARVLGLGASGGVSHWWTQRVNSVALVPLGLWLVVSLLAQPDLGYESTRAWLARPWNAVLMLVLIPVLAQHSRLGVQVVLEDYMHAKGRQVAALLASQFLHGVVAVAAIYAVLRVALGSPA